MQPNEEIMQFLKDNPTFYLATVDGYLPRVRPLGFAMWYNGHLCLGIGKHNAAYKQLLDNTNLELCACNDRGEWLRIQGSALSISIIFRPNSSQCRARSRTL